MISNFEKDFKLEGRGRREGGGGKCKKKWEREKSSWMEKILLNDRKGEMTVFLTQQDLIPTSYGKPFSLLELKSETMLRFVQSDLFSMYV